MSLRFLLVVIHFPRQLKFQIFSPLLLSRKAYMCLLLNPKNEQCKCPDPIILLFCPPNSKFAFYERTLLVKTFSNWAGGTCAGLRYTTSVCLGWDTVFLAIFSLLKRIIDTQTQVSKVGCDQHCLTLLRKQDFWKKTPPSFQRSSGPAEGMERGWRSLIWLASGILVDNCLQLSVFQHANRRSIVHKCSSWRLSFPTDATGKRQGERQRRHDMSHWIDTGHVLCSCLSTCFAGDIFVDRSLMWY